MFKKIEDKEHFFRNLADVLLDDSIETKGVDKTIKTLIELGYTREDILYLNFDNVDIDYVEEHFNDIY